MKTLDYIGKTIRNYYVEEVILGSEHDKKKTAIEQTKIRFELDEEAQHDKAREECYRNTRPGVRQGQFKPYDDGKAWAKVRCNCGISPSYWCRVDNNLSGTHGQSCPMCKNRSRIVPDNWKRRSPNTPINYKRIDNLTGQTFKDWFVLGINNKSLDAAESHTWYDCINSLGEIDVKRGCDLRALNN